MFSHLSVTGYLDCLHFLALMINAVMTVFVHVFQWTCTFISPTYVPRSGVVWSSYNSLLNFSEELPGCFAQWLHDFSLPSAEYEGSNIPISSPTFVIIYFTDESHPNGREWYLTVVFICNPPITKEVEEFSCVMVSVRVSSLDKRLSRFFAQYSAKIWNHCLGPCIPR